MPFVSNVYATIRQRRQQPIVCAVYPSLNALLADQRHLVDDILLQRAMSHIYAISAFKKALIQKRVVEPHV
jgi:hypothetical protein